jgi:hypothetical protein
VLVSVSMIVSRFATIRESKGHKILNLHSKLQFSRICFHYDRISTCSDRARKAV